jgi:hypothetical protein
MLRGSTIWKGCFKCREVKTGFCRNRSMQSERLSLAGYLVKPILSLYGTKWREHGYGFRSVIGSLLGPQTIEYTERQRPLSGVHSIMMEKLAQAGEGGGCTPFPFHYIYHHVQLSCAVRSSWEGRYTPHIYTLLCDWDVLCWTVMICNGFLNL